MKIALAASGVGHVQRGIETWIDGLSRLLSPEYDVTLFQGGKLLAGQQNQPQKLPCIKRDARIWGGVSSPIPWTLRMYLERLSFAPGLIARLPQFDILHTADPFLATLSVWAKRLGWWKGETILAYQGPGPVWNFYANRVGHVQFLDGSYISGPGALVKDKKKVSVIPNFVDTEVFSPGDTELSRRSLNLNPQGPLILSVGAITAMKGIDLLAKGVLFFRDKLKVPAELLLVGQSQDDSETILKRVSSYLGEALHVKLDLPHHRMPVVYKAADVFALGSPFEPFGIAFIEAMASGLPVLGNRVQPTINIIGSGGLTVDLTSPEQIANAMAHLIQPQVRKEVGNIARHKAVREYSVPVVMGKIHELYNQIGQKSQVQG